MTLWSNVAVNVVLHARCALEPFASDVCGGARFVSNQPVLKFESRLSALNTANTATPDESMILFVAFGLFVAALAAFVVLLLVYFKKTARLRKVESELKLAKQQLIEQEKFASLGQLTAGIAHEIKNPLNFVNNFSQLSEDLINDFYTAVDEAERQEILNDLKSNLSKINQHGKRADRIVQSMLQHSRGNKGEKQPTDLNKLCDEFADLAFHGMRATNPGFNCKIEKRFDAALPPVKLVPQDFSRVILNLLNNAFYAVKDKPNALVEVRTELQNNQAVIAIRDNGTGMPEQVKQKIFEPFYTTKPSGEGTGLGLSMSYDIVTKEHGGTMEVYSREHEFTEFIIKLAI